MVFQGRVLVIAGSDCSGGAGLEADQKVIAAHGCYAMTATTALTVQNTLGVHDIHITPPEFVGKQINACISDVGVDVVKIGMLASTETIQVVAKELSHWKVPSIVLDPVMISTSGDILVPEEALKQLKKDLLPLVTILSPNIPEAKLLVSDSFASNGLQNLDDLISLAKAVHALGPKFVLLKGGHSPLTEERSISTKAIDNKYVVDVLCGENCTITIESQYQNTANTHGTGCSLASAIASNLANGIGMVEAVRSACRYIEAGIRSAPNLGRGNGPINHFHSLYTLPFAPGHFIDFLLERSDVKEPWSEYTEHKFVRQMADGTLPLESFKRYLTQDYLFLIQFARANALASYKARGMDEIAASAKIVTHIHTEMALHINYCKEFGVSKEEMEMCEESQACTAYTRYVLDIGQSQDWLALQIAMAPCLIGYGLIAERLYADQSTKRDGNTYWTWIENYVAEDYTDAVKVGSALLEKHALKQSASRIEELVRIFIHATRMEAGFWDTGSRSSEGTAFV